MPPLDDQIEDMASSNMSDLDDTVAAPTPAPAAEEAASSPATGANEVENDLLSVVRDVVKESRTSEPASPAGGEEQGQDDQNQPKQQDDENFSDVPFHKHPRFQHLLRSRNALKEDATRYQNVVGFLDNAGLSAEEAADGLQIMGLAKTNPAEAWKQIRPWLEKLVVAAGEVLPQELQQRVQQGQLTQEAAQEIARANARAASVEATQSFHQQRAERQQQTEYASSMMNAAREWEEDRFAKDPNFSEKFEAVRKEVLYLHATEGKPNTPEGVKAQLKKAYAAVNASYRPSTPAPQPRQPVRPVTGGQVAGNQQPAPASGKQMSTLDVIRANRRR